MSFSQNPYRWFEFFTTSCGNIVRYCPGCGGEGVVFPIGASARELIQEQHTHILESHGRSVEDFADWSQPNHRDLGEFRKTEIPNVRRRLADYLSDYAHEVVQEWMRIVEIDESVEEPGSTAFQARASWAGDGTFVLGRDPHSADFGQYRLTVRVEALPDLPPIGPENDPAQIEEMRCRCPQERCEHNNSEDGPVDWSGKTGNDWATSIEPVEPDPEWVTSEWRFVLNADHIRLNGQETHVATSSANGFYADNSDPYRPSPWQHTEVLVELAHLAGRKLPFPASGPVEILMNRDRKAAYVLQQAFPGTREVK